MAQLLRDITSHRRSASCFAAVWIVVAGLTALTWHDGLSLAAMAALAVLPFMAGAIVGWWRISANPADDHPCGMLAGALVALFDIAIVFVLDWKFSTTNDGSWQWGVFALWLVIGAVFAAVGAAIGFIGGLTAHVARRPTASS
jgi:hypothetical protein